jgi:hypothetical protein
LGLAGVHDKRFGQRSDSMTGARRLFAYRPRIDFVVSNFCREWEQGKFHLGPEIRATAQENPRVLRPGLQQFVMGQRIAVARLFRGGAFLPRSNKLSEIGAIRSVKLFPHPTITQR